MEEHWGRLKAEMADVGLKWEILFKRLPLRPPGSRSDQDRGLIRDQLIP